MWGVIFFLWGCFGGVCPPPPTPVLQRIVLAPMPHPMGARRSFRGGGGGGQSQKAPHVDKKNVKTNPPPHGEKIAKRPPHGEKRGKLKALTWRKSNKKSPHIVAKFFFIFRGGVRLLLHPLTNPPSPLLLVPVLPEKNTCVGIFFSLWGHFIFSMRWAFFM